jgi:uncharacterized protein with NRDE domain
MCLLVFAWRSHPRYRLIFAGNRDEFHDRPAAPMQWWKDAPAILAGRDLKAGGTWLGLSRNGRFGVVTNYRDLQRPVPGAPSRGELVSQWLNAAQAPLAFVQGLESNSRAYAGFNLLVADDEQMAYGANRAPEFARVLQPGIYGLSNHLLDTPWPKLTRTRARFERIVSHAEPTLAELEEMLADREPTADSQLPQTGLPPERERLLSAPFIVDPQYGTRCTTVVLVEHRGHVQVRERRFDPAGRMTGMEDFAFEPQPRRADGARA